MSAPNITDILQNDALQIQTTVGADGREFEFACNHAVISQLVKQKLLTQVGSIPFAPSYGLDWAHYLSNDAEYQFLLTDLDTLLRTIQGVVSVDLTNTNFEVLPFLEIDFICFTVDCANSVSCQEVSI